MANVKIDEALPVDGTEYWIEAELEPILSRPYHYSDGSIASELLGFKVETIKVTAFNEEAQGYEDEISDSALIEKAKLAAIAHAEAVA